MLGRLPQTLTIFRQQMKKAELGILEHARHSLRNSYNPRLKLHLQNTQCDKSVAPTSRTCATDTTERPNDRTRRSTGMRKGTSSWDVRIQVEWGERGWWKSENKLLSTDRECQMGGLRNMKIFEDTMNGIPQVFMEDFLRAQLKTLNLHGLCVLILLIKQLLS